MAARYLTLPFIAAFAGGHMIAAPIDYAAKIAPIFQERCVDCHGKDDPDGELNLESFEALIKGGKSGKAIVKGRAQDSLLVKFLEGRSGKEGKNQFMPPGKKEHLKPAEIALIREWIDSGAAAPVADAKPADVLAKLPKVVPHGEVKHAIRALAISEQSNLLAVGRFGSVELLDAKTRESIRVIKDLAGNVNALALSADGRMVFAAAGDSGLTGIAYQIQTSDGRILRKFEGHTDALYALALSPEGKVLATGGYDQKIKLWDTANGAEIKTLKGHNGCVHGLSFRPDGGVLASASSDRTVKLWDVKTGARLDTFSQPLKEQFAVAFSPDGRTLAAAGADNRIRLWSISAKAVEGSNPVLQSRFAHDGAIIALLFAERGRTLISSAADRTVKLWNAADMAERLSLEKQSDWAAALAVSADQKIFAGRLDGNLCIYQLADGKPITNTAKPKTAAKPKAKMDGKPELTRVWPRGVQTGTTAVLQVTGRNLAGVKSVNFACPCFHPQVMNVKPDGTGFDLKIMVDVGLKPNGYEFTAQTEQGETAKLKIYADDLPQVVGAKSVERAHALPLNIWSTLTAVGQQDSHRFHAKQGQTMVLDLAVKRVESKAQTPRLQLFDAAGKQIASNSGLDSGSDPFLAFTAPQDGDFIARVSEITLEGSPDHAYRLTIGALPFVTGFWPLSVPANQESEVHLVGPNVPSKPLRLKAGAAGEVALALEDKTMRARVPLKVLVSDLPEVLEAEPNNDIAHAQHVGTPVSINGRLHNEVNPDAADEDFFAFDAKQGQRFVIETRAAMLGSPADTKIEVLDAKGMPVPRLVLRAVRDSWINFRSVDAVNPDIRLENWQEMEMNQFVYLGGDVLKIFRMPRGPDSGLLFYADNGKRRSYFGTSATAHSVDEPAYIVEPHPVGARLPQTGLPVMTLNYANDDDGERELGRDSRLIFEAPAAGRYHVRVTDARGWSGDRYAYRLVIREPKPDFAVKIPVATLNVGAGSAASFGVRADRADGFDGDIRVDISGVPDGFFIASPVTVQAGHNSANGCLHTKSGAKTGAADFSRLKVTASAMIDGREVRHEIAAFPAVNVQTAPKQIILLEADVNGKPSGDGRAAPQKPYEITIAPGQIVSAWLRVNRNGNDALVSLDVENLPHGVIVDNIGLNGVQIREKENEREIFLRCAKWVPEQDRLCFAVVGSARNDAVKDASTQASFPVLLKVRSSSKTGLQEMDK